MIYKNVIIENKIRKNKIKKLSAMTRNVNKEQNKCKKEKKKIKINRY